MDYPTHSPYYSTTSTENKQLLPRIEEMGEDYYDLGSDGEDNNFISVPSRGTVSTNYATPTKSLQVPEIKFKLLDERATMPSKGTLFSAGFDICLVHKFEEKKVVLDNGDVIEFYGTGLAYSLPDHWSFTTRETVHHKQFGPRETESLMFMVPYFKMVPRSSMAKSGYQLANGVGILDADYRDEIIVALRFCGEHQIELPTAKPWVQIILELTPYVSLTEVESVEETERTGGFGSTTE